MWLALCALAGPAEAQPSPSSDPASPSPIGAIDALANHLAKATERRWAGQRVPAPVPRTRPDSEVSRTSLVHALTVHAPADISERRLRRTLTALENAQTRLVEEGWGRPPDDGGLGDPAAFDLYLVHGPDRPAEGVSDGRALWSFLDSASGFAVVDADIEDEALDACVSSAYAQTILLGLDPAESTSWRRATGDWLSWRITGRFGCDESVREQQREPWRSPIGTAAAGGEGGALWIAFLSSRHDHGSGRFIRDIWEIARQRTWDGIDLRGSPDLWEALEVAAARAGDDMTELVEDYAAARWFVGDTAREASSPTPHLARLPNGSIVSAYVETIPWEALPEHTPVALPPLQPLGSAYVLFDVGEAPSEATLRLWLRGEFGVRWSFVAIRLDEDGRELGRMADAPRERNPRGFLPLSLFEGTRHVLVTVTNLSSRLPDADVADANARSFKLVAEAAHE